MKPHSACHWRWAGVTVIGVFLIGAAAPACAADARDYCPARPGLGTPACTIAPGKLSFETSIIDWSRDDTQGVRTDTILIADSGLRIGVTNNFEIQLAWTPYGHVRTRDLRSSGTATSDAVGDVTLAAKLNLRHPDGQGFAVAVQPFVTLPVGRSPIGAGDWGAGVLVPVTYDLGHGLNAQFTGEIDAATNSAGRGRHLAYSGTLGLSLDITKNLVATAEVQARRDDDPAGPSTQRESELSFAWMATPDLQLDAGVVLGLDKATSDVELIAGIARRF